MAEQYEKEPHSFTLNVGHWPVCIKCGLVMMKNPFSDWAVKMGCNNKDHPSYESVRRKHTSLESRTKK